jgi:spore coat protein A, manganese oxidase
MKKITRRDFLKGSVAAGAFMAFGGPGSLFLPKSAFATAYSPQLAKWIDPLRGLTALGDANGIPCLTPTALNSFGVAQDFYNVTVGEFTDQLHRDLGPTRLYGYWDTNNPLKRHLGGVIVATRNKPVRIRFTNMLPSTNIIPVDTTVPGANQAQNRTATHLHGGLVPWISDGGPFDWWSPNGSSGMSFQNGPGSIFDNLTTAMAPGQADYFYPNDQSTRLVWYHDHAFGITRINAYAGVASGYLIIDPTQDALLGNKLPPLTSTIPLIFQDKVFVNPATIGTTDPTWASVARSDVQSLGSLWYEHVYDPALFRLLKGAAYLTPPNPSAIPEFFGDTMLCNGTVYPLVTVEAKRYRLLFLNACNARFLNINLLEVAPNGEIATDPGTLYAVNPAPGPSMIQIGTEGGYLPFEVTHTNDKPFSPVTLTGNLLLGNAERADVIVDFTGLAGREYIMYNDAPGPFPGGPPTNDFYLNNPLNPVQPLAGTGPDTRQILRIKVVAGASDSQPAGAILNPAYVSPPLKVTPVINNGVAAPMNPPAGVPIRDLTLNEDFDRYGRLRQLLGTTKPNLVGKGFGLEYLAPATEVVNAGAEEVWRIFNLTADTHPIHFHLVNVQVLSRQPFGIVRGRFTPTGTRRGPELEELGWKETVKMHPGEVISVYMKFDLPALPASMVIPSTNRASAMGLPAGPTYHEYVWHCHILEHEEHDMMRPLIVKS